METKFKVDDIVKAFGDLFKVKKVIPAVIGSMHMYICVPNGEEGPERSFSENIIELSYRESEEIPIVDGFGTGLEAGFYDTTAVPEVRATVSPKEAKEQDLLTIGNYIDDVNDNEDEYFRHLDLLEQIRESNPGAPGLIANLKERIEKKKRRKQLTADEIVEQLFDSIMRGRGRY